MAEIDTPWMPQEIEWLYNWKKEKYNGGKGRWDGTWLEAERILTYSEKLRPLSCKCHVMKRKDGVINMMNKLGNTIDTLWQRQEEAKINNNISTNETT